MNPEKSTAQGTPKPKGASLFFEQQSEGLKVTREFVEVDGKAESHVATMIFDGKDHPYDDPDHICDTSSARRVNSKSIEVVCKAKGELIENDKFTLCSDNNEMTLIDTLKADPNFKLVMILERQ